MWTFLLLHQAHIFLFLLNNLLSLTIRTKNSFEKNFKSLQPWKSYPVFVEDNSWREYFVWIIQSICKCGPCWIDTASRCVLEQKRLNFFFYFLSDWLFANKIFLSSFWSYEQVLGFLYASLASKNIQKKDKAKLFYHSYHVN